MTMRRDHARQLREQRGWSQRWVGEQIGVSQQTINNFELGKSDRLKHLPELARLYGVDTDWLLYGEGHTPKRVINESSTKVENHSGATTGGEPPMSSTKAKLLKHIIDMPEDRAAALYNLLSTETQPAHPLKRGTTS